ncbi:MAG: hypothetical protein IT244_05485, partial [Bacteroidia bacterium]|nr:hypothetical protein [Bacteroidia bacterium]
GESLAQFPYIHLSDGDEYILSIYGYIDNKYQYDSISKMTIEMGALTGSKYQFPSKIPTTSDISIFGRLGYYEENKRFQLCFLIGGELGNWAYKKDSGIYNHRPVDYQSVWYLSYTCGLGIQYTGKPLKTINKTSVLSPIIQLTANYNLPLIYRFTQYEGKETSTYKFVNRFNEIFVTAKAGFYPFFASISYYPTQYTIDPFPSRPKVTLGFGIQIVSE